MTKAADNQRVTVFVRGDVQGVGFRWWVNAQARELGLAGSAKNIYDGRVEVVAQGSEVAVNALVHRLEERPSLHRRPGRVTGVTVHPATPVDEVHGFQVC